MKKLDIKKIIQVPLREDQYYAAKHEKKQIYLHHTVSGQKPLNVVHYWNSNAERVATAFIVSSDEIVQCYSSRYWAHHLGTKLKVNTILNKKSIGIEICNWGGLTQGGYKKDKKWIAKDKSKFYNFSGGEVVPDNIIDYGKKIRGYQFYEKYTSEQIEFVRQLLVYLCETYKIPTEYNEDIFDYCDRAIKGDSGIFTHVSVRKDKSDCHPQPELIEMLKKLK